MSYLHNTQIQTPAPAGVPTIDPVPLLWARREYIEAPACGSRVTTSSLHLKGTNGQGFDRGPDDGDGN